jgi:hypothetical protein
MGLDMGEFIGDTCPNCGAKITKTPFVNLPKDMRKLFKYVLAHPLCDQYDIADYFGYAKTAARTNLSRLQRYLDHPQSNYRLTNIKNGGKGRVALPADWLLVKVERERYPCSQDTIKTSVRASDSLTEAS